MASSQKRKEITSDDDAIEVDEEIKRNKLMQTNISSQGNSENSSTQPKLRYPQASKPPNQPTIVITVDEDQINHLKSSKLNKMLSEHLKAKIKERSVVKNRLYLVPLGPEDTEEILKLDTDFFTGAPRKILNDKFHSIVAFNISNQEIEKNRTIQTELVNRGVVCWEPLQKAKPELRSVKLHFNDREKTSHFLRNFYVDDLKIYN